MAFDVRSRTPRSAPAGLDMLIAGFVCKARSKANRQGHTNEGCVREGKEDTDMSFDWTFDYSKKAAELRRLGERRRAGGGRGLK
eukprot:5015778-Pyramimonas_sp.AAC.1